MAVQNVSKSCDYFKTRKINVLLFENVENFEQSESKLESNWHWPKMRKNDRFLIKNEFQRPRFGGRSFGSQKACPFCRVVRILIYGNRFSNLKKNLESNWHWLKMGKNGQFLVKNEFQRPRLGGVFLIAKSVSLLSWGPDFDLWKSFQSRLLRPNGRLRRNDFSVRHVPLGNPYF